MRHVGKTTKTIRNLFVIGERKVFQEILNLVHLSVEANAIVGRMMAEGGKGEAMAAMLESLRTVEKRGDDIAFSVSEGITGGAISPNLLDNLLESAEVADRIIDHYYNLGRELERMSNVDLDPTQTKFKAEFEPLFETLRELADQAFDRLEKLLELSDMEDIVATRKSIQRLEERGDDVKDAGFDKLYSLAPKLHYVQFIHYSELLHKFDDVLDACEDLSDLIVSVFTSVSR